MTLFKQIIDENRLVQSEIARQVECHPVTISNIVNHNEWPKKDPEALEERIRVYFTELNISLPSDLFSNPDEENYTMYQKKILSQDARQLFNLVRDPFLNDVRGIEDVYLTDGQRFVRNSILDAIEGSGIIAIIGESGAGKTVMRRTLIDTLTKENQKIRIIHA